jgi:hypothetical protein
VLLATAAVSAAACFDLFSPLPAQDFFQLLRPGLDILRPGRPAKGARGPGLQHFTADSFREQFGIEPHQVTFWSGSQPRLFCWTSRRISSRSSSASSPTR